MKESRSMMKSDPAMKSFEKGEYFSIRQLLEGIFSRLYPLFSIDCAVLTLYDNDHRQISRSYVVLRNNVGENIAEQRTTDPLLLSGISSQISQFQFPVLKSAADWRREFGENHYLPGRAEEYTFHCYIPLEVDNRVLGTFELHNLDKEFSSEALNFCCNISDLLSGLLVTIEDPINNEAHDDKPLIGVDKAYQGESLMAVDAGAHNSQTARPAEEELLAVIKEQQLEIDQYQLALSKHEVYTTEEKVKTYHYPEIAGSSPEMQQVFKLLDKISSGDTTVLILGETGTGKELIAKAIHQNSARKDRPLIKINCAAVPPNLIESELFGHEKGSFTGATERRTGKFELADKGTIFLDEVGELSPDLQVKLLRVLQEKEIERIGGKHTISTDVRIISATNRNLFEEVEAGRFRADLFYRLNVFPIELPPLRHRRSDIPALAAYFLQRFNGKSGKNIRGFSKKVIAGMMAYSWPGNVRELEHLIERQVVLSAQPVITELAIPEGQKGLLAQQLTGEVVKTVLENERDHIFSVLERCNGKVSGPHGAAKLLGLPATTLNSKIKRLGLSKRHS